MKRAVFLDRDGTIIEQVHYLSSPKDVRLVPGAADGIRELRSRGYACVLVTNQSGIGRGLFTMKELESVHAELKRQLAPGKAFLDGVYVCPYAPRNSDRTAVEHPDRKPGPGMLLRASRELSIDLSRSWMVGDMLSDVHAGRNARCRGTILVRTGHGSNIDAGDTAIDYVVSDLSQAVELILRMR